MGNLQKVSGISFDEISNFIWQKGFAYKAETRSEDGKKNDEYIVFLAVAKGAKFPYIDASDYHEVPDLGGHVMVVGDLFVEI